MDLPACDLQCSALQYAARTRRRLVMVCSSGLRLAMLSDLLVLVLPARVLASDICAVAKLPRRRGSLVWQLTLVVHAVSEHCWTLYWSPLQSA